MREKKRKIVVTFHTTTDAMEMERICHETGVPERLIPVPRTLSSGCGLAWCADPSYADDIETVLRETDITPAAVQEIML